MLMSADPKAIKALALDLDGTILGPGAVLSNRMISIVNKCMQRGLKIIINTGRSIEGAERFRASLGVEGLAIYCNGAVVADMPHGGIVSSILMDKKAADFCVSLSRETGVYCQIYFSDSGTRPRMDLVTEKDRPEREVYYKHTGILAEIGDLKKNLAERKQKGCIKTMFIAEPESLEALRPKLEEGLGDSVYITRTQWNFLELMNAGVSKGKGLEFAMDRLALKMEEVIAFGDDENDIPMLLAAGFSVAPSNAKENVKIHANFIAGSNNDDGVAVFLEEFLDGKQ